MAMGKRMRPTMSFGKKFSSADSDGSITVPEPHTSVVSFAAWRFGRLPALVTSRLYLPRRVKSGAHQLATRCKVSKVSIVFRRGLRQQLYAFDEWFELGKVITVLRPRREDV